MSDRFSRVAASVRVRAFAVNSATAAKSRAAGRKKGFFNGAPVLHNSRNDFA
jgi:hypothetical protein